MTDVPERWISLAADAVVGEQAGYCGGYEGCGSFRVSREDSLDIATAALAPVLADLRRQVIVRRQQLSARISAEPTNYTYHATIQFRLDELDQILALIDEGGSDG